jgi:hypothetical protein
MYQLTQLDDYDKVEGVEPRSGRKDQGGEADSRASMQQANRLHRGGQAKMDEVRRETERALLRGKNPEDPIAGDDSFYADEGQPSRTGNVVPPDLRNIQHGK